MLSDIRQLVLWIQFMKRFITNIKLLHDRMRKRTAKKFVRVNYTDTKNDSVGSGQPSHGINACTDQESQLLH